MSRGFELEFDAGRQFGIVHFFQEAVKLFLGNDVVLGSIVPPVEYARVSMVVVDEVVEWHSTAKHVEFDGEFLIDFRLFICRMGFKVFYFLPFGGKQGFVSAFFNVGGQIIPFGNSGFHKLEFFLCERGPSLFGYYHL